MKTNQIKYLGLLIIVMLLLVIAIFYTLNNIIIVGRATTNDIIINIALVDSLIYNTIKLFILIYALFSVSVDFKAKYSEYAKLTDINSMLARLREVKPKVDTSADIKSSVSEGTLKNTLDIAANEVEFEPKTINKSYVTDRYGIYVISQLSFDKVEKLITGSVDEKIKVLGVMLQLMVVKQNINKRTSGIGHDSQLHDYTCNVERDLNALNELEKLKKLKEDRDGKYVGLNDVDARGRHGFE